MISFTIAKIIGSNNPSNIEVRRIVAFEGLILCEIFEKVVRAQLTGPVTLRSTF